METHKKIDLSLDEARELYNSDNETMIKLALRAFTEKDLKVKHFSEITTFEDAVRTIGMNLNWALRMVEELETASKASAAMFKLNIIRKTINLGQNLHLAKGQEDSCISYPFNPLITINTHAYDAELKLGTMEIVGRINVEGEEYNVLGGDYGGLKHCSGLGSFGCQTDICYSLADYAFLGCANKEIARHFSRYFGVLITEAKFGDLDGFKVVRDLYRCVK